MRRKSRHSTNMPTMVDFEYRGNSAGFLDKHVHSHNKTQLDFELNLRGYEGVSDFKADSPWLYPAPKGFAPCHTLKHAVNLVKGSNFDAKKNKFSDRFDESNANGILHTLEASTTVYRNAEWHAALRGDRRERKE